MLAMLYQNNQIAMDGLQIFFLVFALFLQGSLAKEKYTAGRLYHYSSMKSGELSLQETSRKVTEQADDACNCVANIYEHPNYQGRSLTIINQNADFGNDFFHDRADSIKIQGKCKFILYEHCNFKGTAYLVNNGEYKSALKWRGLTDRISSARALPPLGSDAIVLFEHYNYQGRMLVLNASNNYLRSNDFDDRISSIIVTGGMWKIYEHPNFKGRSATINGETECPNSHRRYRLGDTISSVQFISSSRFQTIEEVKNEELDDDEDWSSEY